MEEKRVIVSQEELELALEEPAIFTNKFYLSIMSGQLARITFAEHHPGGLVVTRSAVTMTLGDLIELRDLLVRVTSDVKLIEIPSEPADAKKD